jgi:hypothetical protein
MRGTTRGLAEAALPAENRRMARALALLVLGLGCFAATAFGIYQDLAGYGYLGFSSVAVGDGRFVTAVDPASPSARAGLRTGDVIEEDDRYGLRVTLPADAYAPGVPVALTVRRGGRLFAATLVPELHLATPAGTALDVAKALFAGMFLIVAGRLALARPGLMSNSVFAIALACAALLGLGDVRAALVDPLANVAATVVAAGFAGAGTVGLFLFCALGPGGAPLPRWRPLTGRVPVAVAVVVLAATYSASAAIDLGDFTQAARLTYAAASLAVVAAALAAFVERCKTAGGDARRRLGGFALPGRLDALAERVFFAHRVRARERLSAAAAEVAAMPDRPSIEERFLRDAFEVLELAACGAYRLTRNEYVRTRAFGNADGLPVRFSPNSALAVALRSWPQRPFDLEQLRREPGAPLAVTQPRIAFPVRARDHVAGMFLVTARANGAPLSPAEVELLATVANAAANAYERFAADEARSASFKLGRFSLPFSTRR